MMPICEANRTYQDLQTLTRAEAALLDALVKGATVDAAAAGLSISKKTAQNRLSAIYDKLAVKGFNEAVALWRARKAAA